MQGWVANTDYDWYRFLRGQPEIDEVNFWQPSGSRSFQAIPPGAPFLFKLKNPHFVVAGFGFFAGSSQLPASWAWDAFAEKNGAATFEEMRTRILRYRERPVGPHEDPVIGCLLVARPVFFSELDWVEQPRDWPKQAVQGKTYDLTTGEGKRVWDACQARASALARADEALTTLRSPGDGPRFGAPLEVRPRLGQGIFRVAVLDAYGRACAVTEEHSLPVLEAAHIRPYGEGGDHELRNGLLLRSDLHRLFDKGYVTVTPDLKFHVSPRLKDLWKNGRTYYPLEGRAIRVPERKDVWPAPSLLEWHSEERFQR